MSLIQFALDSVCRGVTPDGKNFVVEVPQHGLVLISVKQKEQEENKEKE